MVYTKYNLYIVQGMLFEKYYKTIRVAYIR